MSDHCLCGKNKLHDKCCGRYLSGKAHAKTPEQLMRSRYCAYALGGYGDYLKNTWHPSMSQHLSVESLSEKTCEWVKLEVIDRSQQGDKGFVEFKAYYKNFSDTKIKVLHEKSVFQRIAGRWFYIGGEIT